MMGGAVNFEGTQEEWDALVKKNAFMSRLITEEKELGEKLAGLSNALRTGGFAEKVGEYQFELLLVQQGAMATYRQVLIMRIKDLSKK
jgi:hypothetical protein